MTLAWLGIAFLAASWLWGLEYYHAPGWPAWAWCIIAGAGLLGGFRLRSPSRWEQLFALVALLPVAYIAPWPYRAIPLLLIAGLAMWLSPLPPRTARFIGSGLIAAGAVLLAQSLTMLAYEVTTARSHDLPGFLATAMAALARLLDIDAGAAGSTLTLGSMRKAFPLGATWELLLDPVTLCFLIGGIVAMFLRDPGAADGPSMIRIRMRKAAALTAIVLLWIPFRLALQLALYMHRSLVTDYEAPINLMNQFFSPALHLLLLAGPVLLAWRFVRADQAGQTAVAQPLAVKNRFASAALVTAALVAVLFGVFWEPAGSPKRGRLLVDEFHSTWEPTQRAMDTAWYGHDSGYNYWCIYEYLTHFYDTQRLTRAIDDSVLSNCDMLMVKVPTRRFATEEVKAIKRFVEAGGGLMLVGEHTNVFGTGAYINDIAREFGFTFRYDCLFGIDSVFDDRYTLPMIPHPIVQHMPPLDFAVSCSIDPGTSFGRAAIRGTALKNMPADYHASNFYPQVEDRAESRYGAFVQVWAARHGKGRVAAFTDSTQWSNFCTFEPGKLELLMGLAQWLNRSNTVPDPRLWLLPIGLIMLAAGAWMARRWSGGWLPLVGGAMLAWAIASLGVNAAHRSGTPTAKPLRPPVQVVMDQTASSIALPKSGFIAGKTDGFGIFERWILRLGYFTSRRSGMDAFSGNLIVYLYPDKPTTEEYRHELARYVRSGGHILVIDSAENPKSTANSLLFAFGMSVNHATSHDGEIISSAYPTVTTTKACEVSGEEILSRINGRPVAARCRIGKGSVTVIGFGARFNDFNMGVTGDLEPDAAMRDVYEVEYRLLRGIIEGRPTTQPTTRPSGSAAVR